MDKPLVWFSAGTGLGLLLVAIFRDGDSMSLLALAAAVGGLFVWGVVRWTNRWQRDHTKGPSDPP